MSLLQERTFSCFCLKWIILAAFVLEGGFFSFEATEQIRIFLISI